MRARGRLLDWDEVVENNKLEYPDPRLPTYEHCPEWVEGEYTTRHVSVPFAHIDYIKHEIDGYDVDPDTIEVLS
jgi:hypothetical protein